MFTNILDGLISDEFGGISVFVNVLFLMIPVGSISVGHRKEYAASSVSNEGFKAMVDRKELIFPMP